MPECRPLRERLLERIRKTDSCWLWTAGKAGAGYGSMYVGEGHGMLAHRVAYELFVGRIPEGKYVLHRYDNRLCVNPAHLFLGTQLDNVRDSVAKGRRTVKLTEKQVREIRAQYQRGSHEFGTVALARRYGVSDVSIWNIVRGRKWRHVRIG